MAETTSTRVTPYLFFGGNGREAASAYHDVFGGKLELMTYGDMKGDACPVAEREQVAHACLSRGGFVLMLSDRPDGPTQAGNNVFVSVECGSLAELEQQFAALSEGGQVKHALHDTFWGARFGTLTDRFGVHWMLQHQLAPPVG